MRILGPEATGVALAFVGGSAISSTFQSAAAPVPINSDSIFETLRVQLPKVFQPPPQPRYRTPKYACYQRLVQMYKNGQVDRSFFFNNRPKKKPTHPIRHASKTRKTPRGTRTKGRLYCRTGYHLDVRDSEIIGSPLDNSKFGILEFISIAFGLIAIRGERSGNYVCMDDIGRLYGKKDLTSECVFMEKTLENFFNTYASCQYTKGRKPWYLAINKRGRTRRGDRSKKQKRYAQFLVIHTKNQTPPPLMPHEVPQFSIKTGPITRGISDEMSGGRNSSEVDTPRDSSSNSELNSSPEVVKAKDSRESLHKSPFYLTSNNQAHERDKAVGIQNNPTASSSHGSSAVNDYRLLGEYRERLASLASHQTTIPTTTTPIPPTYKPGCYKRNREVKLRCLYPWRHRKRRQRHYERWKRVQERRTRKGRVKSKIEPSQKPNSSDLKIHRLSATLSRVRNRPSTVQSSQRPSRPILTYKDTKYHLHDTELRIFPNALTGANSTWQVSTQLNSINNTPNKPLPTVRAVRTHSRTKQKYVSDAIT